MPDMEKLNAVEPKIQEIKNEQRKIYDQLDYYKKVIGEKEEKINDVKQQSQAHYDKKAEIRELADKFSKQIE